MGIGKTQFAKHSSKFPGVYRGTVMDNTDPSKYGRVRVKIYPMLSDVETANLPWAVPAFPLSSGSGSGIGNFMVPTVGTNVFIMFEQGDIYQPIYWAEAPDAVKGLPVSRLVNYPNRKVMRTSSGIEIVIDDSAPSLKFVHPAGTSILVGPSGEITISSAGAVNISGATVNINPLIGIISTTMFGDLGFGEG